MRARRCARPRAVEQARQREAQVVDAGDRLASRAASCSRPASRTGCRTRCCGRCRRAAGAGSPGPGWPSGFRGRLCLRATRRCRARTPPAARDAPGSPRAAGAAGPAPCGHAPRPATPVDDVERARVSPADDSSARSSRGCRPAASPASRRRSAAARDGKPDFTTARPARQDRRDRSRTRGHKTRPRPRACAAASPCAGNRGPAPRTQVGNRHAACLERRDHDLGLCRHDDLVVQTLEEDHRARQAVGVQRRRALRIEALALGPGGATR